MHSLEISGKLVDMRTTCIHLLKIASDSNFSLLFWEKLLAFSKLASSKFDPCLFLMNYHMSFRASILL